MTTTNRRHGAVLLSGGVLLAALGLTSVALPASAAPPQCRGEVATIVGTEQGEVIVGTDGADVIVAKGGADTVRGLEGADIVCAGAGEDSVHGGTGRDELEGGNAEDTLIGGKGQDRLRGNAGDDDLDGGLHRDTCFQGAGTGERVNCENPFAAPTPAPKQPETAPAPTPTPTPKPTPKPDSDGDGVSDDVDTCPTKGDQGYGVDGTGCPKPQPCTYTFPDAGGTLPTDFEPVGAGDRICGGPGPDVVATMWGGTFEGGAGDDSVSTSSGDGHLFMGTFYGGAGNDFIDWQNGGTFYGGDGVDRVTHMFSTFYGQSRERLRRGHRKWHLRRWRRRRRGSIVLDAQ